MTSNDTSLCRIRCYEESRPSIFVFRVMLTTRDCNLNVASFPLIVNTYACACTCTHMHTLLRLRTIRNVNVNSEKFYIFYPHNFYAVGFFHS